MNLNGTLGAAFLGNVFSAMLYGVTCLQIFIYYKNGGKDSLTFRLVISVLWIFDTLQMAFITHAVYYYLVENFANPYTLAARGVWSLLVQIYVAVSSNLIIRLIYGRRVWIITNHNIPLVIVIVVTSLVAFGGGVAFTTSVFAGKIPFASLSRVSHLMYLSLASGVAADITLAATLCISLSRSRTRFKRMNTIFQTLMIYTINSCLLTTLCSTLCFITYAIWSRKFIFIAFYFCFNRLFLNSLLGMLNGRSAFKQEQPSELPTIPTHSSQSLAQQTQSQGIFVAWTRKKASSLDGMQPKLQINTEHHREVETIT